MKTKTKYIKATYFYTAIFTIIIFSAILILKLKASAPDAWEEFRNDIKVKMESSIKDTLEEYTITINPFGTESYGVAIASGVNKEENKPMIIVGIYDKKTKKLEIADFPSININKIKLEK